MEKKWVVLLVFFAAITGLAEKTNEPPRPQGDVLLSEQTKHRKNRERKYQFMNRVLTDIGVSDEDKIKIRELQKIHRGKMKENFGSSTAARKKLSELQENGASKEEIDRAIQNVSDTMTDQLRILVYHRMEMEKILGKEKYTLFMQSARRQFKRHGRRSGSGLPPLPSAPPLPPRP